MNGYVVLLGIVVSFVGAAVVFKDSFTVSPEEEILAEIGAERSDRKKKEARTN